MKKILFIGIFAIALVLRFWNLGIVPTGPNWDEAALGYNAYSILRTGKDEYGISFPLSLRSYDDYKPPLYMYLTIPSVAIFDLHLWSVRLPAVIVGLLAVIGVFFLSRELFFLSEKFRTVWILPYLVMFFFAVSPWHLQFSRMAFEAGIGVSINIWAVYFFLRGVKKPIFLSFSASLFALSLYAYHSQRIFAPLLVMLLGVVFFKELLKNWKFILFAIFIGIVTLAPLFPVFTDPNTLTRLRGTSALADQTRLLERSVQKLERSRTVDNTIGILFDNRRIVFAQTLLSGYLSHFSPVWLFITGDNARHHAPGMGLLYLVELPLLFLGLYVISSKGKKASIIVLGWMLIAPVAASPTTELPHAIRTLVFLPTFQIVVALGLYQLVSTILKTKMYIRYAFISIIIVGFLFNIIYYLHMYHVQQNREYSKFWQYGYQQAVEYVQAHYNSYDRFVVSTKLEQPHMFFLFFLKYDPKKYLAEGGTASGGFEEVKNKFDKFIFRPIHWDQEVKDGKTLFIGTPSEIPSAAVKKIQYLNGEDAMVIAQ